MTRLLKVIWVILSILAFAAFVYWSDPLRNAVSRLRPIGLAMLVLAAATGVGWLATRWYRRDFLLYVATGIGLLALTVLLLGAAAYLEPTLLTIIVVTGAVLFVAAIAVERPWRAVEPGCGPWRVVGWVGLGAAVVAIVPFLVAPELSTDSLQYHLLVPRLYLDQGAIRYIPLLVGSNYPSLAEYVYLVILAIGDDVGTKSFHFLMALVVLLTIRRLVRQLVPDSDGVLAAALFFVTPVALVTAAWSLNDMVFTFFLLLSASELLERRLVTAGLLFGLATWTKYTFVLFLIPFAAMLFLGVFRKLWRARDLARFAIPAMAVASIWMLKNGILTGNPVYPFLNEIFQSPYWDEVSDRYFRRFIQQTEYFVWDWKSYFTFPFLLTLRQSVVDAHPGALWLILLPLLFIGGVAPASAGGDERTSLLRTFVAGTVVSWLLIHSVTRSLLAMFAVMAVLFAATIARRPYRFLIPLIAAGFAANLWLTAVTTGYLTKPLAFFFGLESGREFLSREEPRQRLYLWMNDQPSVGGALLVSLHDPYYLRRQMLFSSACDKPAVQDLIEKNGTVAGMTAALRSHGITHVAVDRREYARENTLGLFSWTAEEREVFRRFLRTSCRPVTSFGDIVVFQLTG